MLDKATQRPQSVHLCGKKLAFLSPVGLGKMRRSAHELMNLMLLIKTGFVMAIFLLLVLMGVHNRIPVDFSLPPLVAGVVQQPAALMYFGFFAIGVLTGTVLTFGVGGRKAPPPSKPGVMPPK